MKLSSKPLPYFVIIAGFILSLASQDAVAQGPFLVVENQKTHTQRVVGRIGKNLRYKLVSSDVFKQGHITAITDSTISVESDIPGLVIDIRHRDLSAVKYPKGNAEIVLGTAVIVGAIALAVSAINQKVDQYPVPVVGQLVSGIEEEGKLGAIILSVPILIIGIAIVSPRKTRLGKTWEIKTRTIN